MSTISRSFKQNHGAYKLCIFYRLIATLYYVSAHYSKEKLRQLIMQNIMYAITQHYYALNSFIDLAAAHLLYLEL